MTKQSDYCFFRNPKRTASSLLSKSNFPSGLQSNQQGVSDFVSPSASLHLKDFMSWMIASVVGF
jgi:hypothetical protein